MIVQVKEGWGGETLAKSYTANALNQYTAIANPDAVGLRGSATNTATVSVNGNAALSDNVASSVVPWHYALLADNANGGDYTFAEIMAVVNPPGTNTPDVVESTSGSVYAPPQAEALTYDDDGNLLNDGRFNYTWNGENRLVKAEEQVCPTNRTLRKVEYAYDHQGRMVWKVVSHRGAEAQSWEAEKSIAYLWDGLNIIAETTGSDSATNTTYNIWGLDLDGSMQGAGGVGGLLAVISPLPLGEGQGEGSAVYLPRYDANGNIMEYVSDDGTIVAHREYDPFGGTVVATGDVNAFTHWFSTKPWCSITGLSEYQYRKYNPVLGRWLNRDPIEERGGLNLYIFANNSAIIYYDTLGLFWGHVQTCAQILSGAFTVSAGIALGAAAGWTGIGAVGAVALIGIGADQFASGVRDIITRSQDREPGTYIQTAYRFYSEKITGRTDSGLEYTLDTMYFAADITAACATGALSIRSSVLAIKGTQTIFSGGRWITINGWVRYEHFVSGGLSFTEAGVVVATESFSSAATIINYVGKDTAE